MPLIAVLATLGAVYYFTTKEEKRRFLLAVSRVVRQAMEVVARFRPKPGPFDAALRERTSRAIATPAFTALSIGIFFCVVVAPGAVSDPETLVRWGASFGPRTTNGEWWRLVTAMFVHASFFQLLVNTAALVQMGLIVERLFGRLSFASAYLAAGLTSTVISLSMQPIGVAAGSSGSVWGVLGLFVTWLIAGTLRPSPLTIPLTTVLMTSPSVALFVLYSMAAGFDGRAELAGLVVGVIYGLVLVKDAGERTPPLLRAAATMGAVVLMAVPVTIPLRGLIDVRPELERVAAVEQSTTTRYDSAVRHFTKGEIPIRELAELIDRTILPELQAAHARLKQLAGVPREHQPMVAAAAEYFTLREKSWRVRADALRRINRATLRQADEIEDAAVRTLGSIAPTAQ